MPRIILLLAALLSVYLVYRHIRALPPERRRVAWLKVGLAALVLVVIIATLTGRMHWLGAAITGLLVFLARVAPVLMRLFPVMQWVRNWRGGGRNAPPPSAGGAAMSRKEAFAVLGLAEGASKQEIIDAHRGLMQKLHPDRGGNDYLAARLNQAKDFLLG